MTEHSEQIVELQKKLDPKFVKDPPQGKYGQYIEGWHAIAEANRIFGHDQWSYDVKEIRLTNEETDGHKHRIGYMAIVTSVAMGVSRCDVGHGQGFGKSLGDAHDSAVKEAVTDALKRSLRSFGNPFGLALYDKTQKNVGVEADENQVNAAIDAINAIGDMRHLADYWSRLAKEQRLIASDSRVVQAKDVRKTELEK